MGDYIPISHRRLVDTPYTAEPKPVMPEAYHGKISQSFEVTHSQDSQAKNVSRQSQMKRHLLDPSISTSSIPLNFSMVSEGLYRSGYPRTQDYPFIQSLNLKTIVTLVSKKLPDGYQEFMYGNHITHKIFDMTGTKKEEIPIELMRDVQAVVSKRENYPLLIHCNHGKHRTGCVIGVFRKCNMWDTERIIDEYRSFAAPKVRETDLKYLKEFKLTSLLLQPQPRILPGTLVRFCRFVVVVALALFTFYPLGQLRLQTPGPKLV